MVGFPPRSVLLRCLMLSWASVLRHGLMSTQWCGNAALASNGEAGEGFSKAVPGFAVPGQELLGFLLRGGYCLLLPSCGKGWGGPRRAAGSGCC